MTKSQTSLLQGETEPRAIETIERDLKLAREVYAHEGPKHWIVERCERLYAELQVAKAA
jgi:hypothetical protein